MKQHISRAPFRIGLAGGGTDVSPYSDLHGGVILNSTIDLYATAVIVPRSDGKIIINAINANTRIELDAQEVLDDIPELRLQVGVYNHIAKNYAKKPLSFELITTIDVPTGSGLGTSSTMVVAIIGAFVEWLQLPLGEYDISQMAVAIERRELKMAGGKQDQYAATFGGFNFMEFYAEDRVIVNPLRIKHELIQELNFHLLLLYTKTKRESSKIIDIQQKNFAENVPEVIEASHQLKRQAIKMKELLLTGELSGIGQLLHENWEEKKKLASGISTDQIENIYRVAKESGAIGGKISGAGGGGFMIFYCPGVTRYNVIEKLEEIGVSNQIYNFQDKGLETWTSVQ